jgi:DNA-directed RNA polymerase subunit A"
MKDKGLTEKQVIEKIKEVTPDFSQEENEVKIRVKNDSLKNIRKMTNKLQEIVLKGVPNINRVIIIEKELDKGKELVLATEGTNLAEVFKIEGVDASRTTTNDVTEISQVLGIEAARNALILEIQKVLEAQELKVNYRHISLIADAMTSKGVIKSVGRHGLAGEKTSVLAKAAFEETAKHLVNACVHGEAEKLRGIAENIIIGQTIPCGTGKIKLVMKTD